jgi:hypothetical protein
VTAAAGVSFCRIDSANDYAAAGAVQLKKLGQDYEMKEMVCFATRARKHSALAVLKSTSNISQTPIRHAVIPYSQLTIDN